MEITIKGESECYVESSMFAKMVRPPDSEKTWSEVNQIRPIKGSELS